MYAHQDAATAHNAHTNLLIFHNQTSTPIERSLNHLQSLARINYYARHHPDLPMTQLTNSSPSDDDNIPDLVSVSDDDDAPAPQSNPSADESDNFEPDNISNLRKIPHPATTTTTTTPAKTTSLP